MRRALLLVLLSVLLFIPMAVCHADTIQMYGIAVDSQETHLDLGDTKISNLNKLMEYLDLLPNVTQVNMYKSRVSIKQLEMLMQRYPAIHFGVTFGLVNKSISTAQTAYSTLNHLDSPRYKSTKFEPLKYCPALQALDLGHNYIDDLTFLTPLTEMKVLILADNRIKDLSVLSQLTKLEYLELFMNDFTDLSPLSSLTNLKDLNLCRNKITDITPLLTLTNLERLWISKNFLTEEQVALLEQSLPDCQINYAWGDCTGDGWRSHIRYKSIAAMFKTGIYTPFE